MKPLVTIPRRRAILYGLILAGACFHLADEIADIALTWVILSHTGSAGWTGFAGAVGMVPLILGAFFSGALIDRIGVRRTARVAAGLGLGVAIAIPVLLGLVGVVLPLLLAVIFAAELFDAPAEIAVESSLPELARFGGMPLERVNALDELFETLAALVGPLVAGVAMTRLGPIATLWTVAAITAVGVAVLWHVLPGRKRDSGPHSANVQLSIRDGCRFIWRTPVLRWITVMAAILTTLLVSLDAVLLPVLIQKVGLSALELGWVLAAGGAGAALGTVGYAWKGRHVPLRVFVLVGIFGLGGSTAALAIFSQIECLCLAAGLGGVAAGPLSPLLNTQVQRLAPRALRGTVIGVVTGAILLCMPVGLLCLGLLAEALGVQAVLVGTAVLIFGSGVWALASPTLAEMDRVSGRNRMTDA